MAPLEWLPWKRLRTALGFLALIALWTLPLGAQTEPSALEAADEKGLAEVAAMPTSADAQLLDDLYRRHAIRSEVPEPGFAQYFQDVSTTLGENLARWLSLRIGGLAGSASQFLVYVGYALLGLLAAVCIWLGIRFLIQRLEEGSTKARGDGAVRDLQAEAATTVAAESWETALRQALADGDVGQAVHALWWWLAQSLECSADPSWTSRELMQRSGRRDLRPHVRRLDRLLYSPQPPRLDDVEILWRDLQPLVASGDASAEGVAP